MKTRTWLEWRRAVVLALCVAFAIVAPAAAQFALPSLGGAPALDLAAIALAPEEVPEPGYGVADRLTGALDIRAAAERLAGDRGDATVAGMSNALLGGNFVSGYWGTLGLPTVAGDAGSPAARLVVSWIVEFATAEGAAVAFAAIEDETGLAGAADLSLDRALGDQTDATRLAVPLQDGGTADVVEVALRTGNLVAEVRLVDFRGKQPDVVTAELLAARLFERATWVAAGNGPQFGNRVLRLTPWDRTRPLSDRYVRWSGRALLAFGGTDDQGAEPTVYVYRFLHPTNGSYYYQEIAEVSSREDAAAWVLERTGAWRDPTEGSGYRDVTVIELAGAAGIEEVTLFGYTWTQPESDKTYRGFAAVYGFGTVVSVTQIHTTNGFPVELATEWLRRQANCLTSGSCLEPEAFPLLQYPGLYVPP